MTEDILALLKRSIESHIEPDLNSGCWLWSRGSFHVFGYGQIMYRRGGKAYNVSAHRASWIVNRGSIPKGYVVCHRCDTPSCVNPDHLFLGTQRDNLRDMYAKGRHRRCGQKLTDEQVRAIRADPRGCDTVSRELGVSRHVVWLARTGKTYKRVA